MTLKERITEDMKAAMRAKDTERLGAIRMLTAAIKQKEVDERVELDDAAVVAIVDKLLKQRKDSASKPSRRPPARTWPTRKRPKPWCCRPTCRRACPPTKWPRK
jgi:hypothetical protein